FYSNFVPNGFWWPDQSLKCRVTDFSREQGKSYTAAEMKDPEVYATNQWLPAGNINRVGYTWRRWYKANTPLNLTADYSVIRYVYPSIRLAEVYYNLAEALNEKPARDGAGACAALNKVRNRVGLPNIEVSYPGIEGDQELLRWCIRQDKMCEYAFEGGMRHSDEVRNMYAKEDYPCDNWTLHLKATNYEDSWQRVNTDYNGENPAVFTDRDYLFPMSSSLMAEMVNYTQNYGF
ncbi:MAG: RagB/SusD family nutrient uptake outer membrane protein, partial [Bacteroidales bacterium]|nr:RagB/SusD family nutrient uptake outer membrane protein [Bacteroidales bacterium]